MTTWHATLKLAPTPGTDQAIDPDVPVIDPVVVPFGSVPPLTVIVSELTTPPVDEQLIVGVDAAAGDEGLTQSVSAGVTTVPQHSAMAATRTGAINRAATSATAADT
ncbi:MAG TPA: hypothetical protein VF875_14915 [Anaeromyxobacter sp.]